MAEERNRTEWATPRRKAEARRKGQVAISRDVPTAAILLGGITLLYVLTGPAMSRMTELMQKWLSIATEVPISSQLAPGTLHHLLRALGMDTLGLVMPVVGSLAVVGAGAYLVQTGFLWHAGGLRVDSSRIDPLAGLRRLFSLRSVIELVKSVLKVTVIVCVGLMAVRHDLGRLAELVQYSLPGILGVAAGLALKMTLWIALSVVVIALADYAYQRLEWERSLKMTRQEVKQELRETEGDPLLRSRVRSIQREMARKRMMAAVPHADVVITNPVHLAVALRYDPAAMSAPVVVAKGAGYLAERIKAIAVRHGVTVVEDKFVARTLYKLVAIGREVPVDLYRAVAEILAFVYRVRGMGPGKPAAGHAEGTDER